MKGGERGSEFVVRRPGNRKIAVDALIAQIERTLRGDVLRGNAFEVDLVAFLAFQLVELLADGGKR